MSFYELRLLALGAVGFAFLSALVPPVAGAGQRVPREQLSSTIGQRPAVTLHPSIPSHISRWGHHKPSVISPIEASALLLNHGRDLTHLLAPRLA